MKTALAIYKRELSAYFTRPTAYAIIIIFLILVMALTFTFGRFFRIGDANLEYSFFFWHPWLFMLLAPAVGMGLWSDEQRTGTIELLGTLPTTIWSAIVGKYLAAATVCLAAVALTFPIWITVNRLGEPDNLTIFSGYLGSFLVCCTFLALTMLVSAFTRDQVVCLIVSVAICVLMVLCSYGDFVIEASKNAPRWLVEAMLSFGVWDHFRSLMRGAFRLQDFVWFTTLIMASLIGTSAILSARRS
ncbi:MAG: ABC transporter permease [Verrucomicrobiota bacterium JB023]|nr:ABC transporter permease [Verrucomicrobiota bacterium JB023]